METITLQKITELNEAQIESLTELLTKRLRKPNKIYTIKMFCKYATEYRDRLPSWIQDRIYFRGDHACYCAGQCYPTELSYIKNKIFDVM